ncbi:MAG: bifunctional 5,10-methylenetetrahydrofolate dehydrogenase/5,10-methenyltetrahydrofolate cyclohydrolase [Candidatus Curtissbacteria bacterium]|nr:bifunctional 5,10-methylenetetrahydrofolate dehydrogenase/5,10-methenyltetrahydrofolate cyclohydrolase [Candidatus Curtissbacteria bacterium]
MAQILDGKTLRDEIEKDLKSKIQNLKTKPKLVIIQIGDVAESNTYIGQKVKFGEKIGAIVTHKKLPEDIPEHELIEQIQLANEDKNVNGIIVQLPIPQSVNKEKIIDTISPEKDVDGQTAISIKSLVDGLPTFIPATTKGVLTLLGKNKIELSGKHAVVVGRSTLVGKPTALALLNRDATVTIAHAKTQNLQEITKSADILIVAVGKPKMITRDFVSENQVVVDVGINVINGKLIGDVDFDEVSKIVAAISPVPGGVGPMTVASLFQNLMDAYKRQEN